MANTSTTTSISYFPSNLLSFLLVILATHPYTLYAQSDDNLPTSSTNPMSITIYPTEDDTTPAAYIPSSPASTAIPSATDSAGYGSTDDDTGASGSRNGVLNYYFLLLAVFVIAMLIIYWTLARRRRRAAAQLRAMQQEVLSEDVRNWTRHRRAEYGFEDEERGRGERVEGLDAAGEAPPAYVKVPERVHLGRGQGVELRGMAGEEGKPPEYEERRA